MNEWLSMVCTKIDLPKMKMVDVYRSRYVIYGTKCKHIFFFFDFTDFRSLYMPVSNSVRKLS